MAIQFQNRRGTVSENNSFTGAAGEVVVDTTNNRLRVHDGATVGGFVVGDYVNVKDFGAVGDGVVDDTTAIQAAVDEGGTVFLPKGIYKITSTIDITNPGCLTILGEGSTPQTALGQNIMDYTFKGTAIYLDGAATSVINYQIDNFVGGNCVIKDIMITSSNTTLDQHGLLITHNVNTFHLDNVVFQNISGYAWCWNSTTDCYSQNVQWNNISALTVGGVIGSTNNAADPGRGGIFTTTFQIDNFNLDQGINQTSPQDYICDMRGMREVLINNFILEGNRADTIAQEYMIWDCDGSVIINNIHMEILTNSPGCWMRFTNESGWYGDSNQKFIINGMNAASSESFVFENSSRAFVKINSLYNISADLGTVDTWVIFNGNYAGSKLVIDGIDKRIGFMGLVPANLKGKVVISNNMSTSNSGTAIPSVNAPLTSLATPIFRYRPDVDGSFTGINTPYFSTLVDSTYNINEVANEDNTACQRLQQSGSRVAFLGVVCSLPDYMVGCTLTFVARFKIDTQTTGDTRSFDIFNTYSTTTEQDIGAPAADEWFTAVTTMNNCPADLIIRSNSSTSGSGSPILNLAAYDIYLGSDFNEPYDLRTL